MSDLVLPFVQRYLADPGLRTFLLGDVHSPREEFDTPAKLLQHSRLSYAAFQYRETLASLTWMFVNDPPRFPRVPASRLTGAEKERIEIYRGALILFDRASAWIGFNGFLDSTDTSRGAEILDDVDLLSQLIGEEYFTSSARAFRLRRAGAPDAAERTLLEALDREQRASNLRSLNDAAGALSFSLGAYPAAVASYAQVVHFDERLSTTLESGALAEAFLNICDCWTSSTSGHKLQSIASAIRACESVKHGGFAWQIRTKLAHLLHVAGDHHEALAVVRSNAAEGYSSGSLAFKHDYYRLFLEAASKHSLFGASAALDELRGLFEPLDRALRGADWFAEGAKEFLYALLDGRHVVSAALLGPLVEYMTRQISRAVADPHSVPHGWTPLAKQTERLFKRGVITYADASLLNHVRVSVRNPLSHGDLSSARIRIYRNPLECFAAFAQVCAVWDQAVFTGQSPVSL